MESPPDFPWGHPWTPPRHLHSPPACSLLPSPISLHRSPNPHLVLHQVPEGLPDFSVLLHKLPECLFNGTQDPIISGDHGQDSDGDVGYTLLFECDIPGTGKRAAMKKKIIKK